MGGYGPPSALLRDGGVKIGIFQEYSSRIIIHTTWIYTKGEEGRLQVITDKPVGRSPDCLSFSKRTFLM